VEYRPILGRQVNFPEVRYRELLRLTLSSSGVISSASPWTQAQLLLRIWGYFYNLTDSRGSNSSVNTSLDLYYSISLTIITPSPHCEIAIVTDDPNGTLYACKQRVEIHRFLEVILVVLCLAVYH